MDKELIKYRDSMLNSKSESFCGAKWGNSTLWLNSGETSSCHLPPVHNINIDQIKKDPARLHTTDHKIKMRRMMQKGLYPPECDYCWKIESMGPDYISDRVFKSLQFNKDEMQEWFDNPADDLLVPPTLEIMFDRRCNFACSYCNPNFSTRWATDIIENGFYELESHGGGAFKHDGSDNNCWENGENPFINAFLKWLPDLVRKLRILRITGGEPLLSTPVWNLICDYIKHEYDFELGINSNLGSTSLVKELTKKSLSMKNLTIFTSMETVYDQAEYIRDGLDYAKWAQNVEYLLVNSNVKRLVFMMTINSLCLFRITEFLDQVLEWKTRYNKKSIGISINFLRFPAFMSLTILPEEIRKKLAFRIDKWFQRNINNPYLNGNEKSDIERLISYIKTIESAHSYDKDLEINRRDFKAFFKQYDKRRNKDISIFPIYFMKELEKW